MVCVLSCTVRNPEQPQTLTENSAGNAWNKNLNDGNVNTNDKATNSNYIRAVTELNRTTVMRIKTKQTLRKTW